MTVSNNPISPDHYKSQTGLEAIEVVEAFNLGFRLGNVVKYLLRADRKGDAIENLEKAKAYLGREISARRGKPEWQDDNSNRPPFIYLATPYTKYPGGMEKAATDACCLASRLIERGIDVYSPIAEGHAIATLGKLDPADPTIWDRFCIPRLRMCDELWVAQLPGWRESRGVKIEIDWMTKAGRKVLYLDPVIARDSDLIDNGVYMFLSESPWPDNVAEVA